MRAELAVDERSCFVRWSVGGQDEWRCAENLWPGPLPEKGIWQKICMKLWSAPDGHARIRLLHDRIKETHERCGLKGAGAGWELTGEMLEKSRQGRKGQDEVQRALRPLLVRWNLWPATLWIRHMLEDYDPANAGRLWQTTVTKQQIARSRDEALEREAKSARLGSASLGEAPVDPAGASAACGIGAGAAPVLCVDPGPTRGAAGLSVEMQQQIARRREEALERKAKRARLGNA